MSDPVFLRAARGETVEHLPVWFMRQAGRSLPEYRALRGTGSILDAIADPALSADITMPTRFSLRVKPSSLAADQLSQTLSSQPVTSRDSVISPPMTTRTS